MSGREPTNGAEGAPEAIGPYSQAMAASGLLFLSGQIPLDPATGEMVAGGFEAETRRAFDNLAAVCRAAGGTLDDLVKLNVYLTDLDNFAAFNEIAKQRLSEPYPARAAVGVAALPKGAQVEIEGVMLPPGG